MDTANVTEHALPIGRVLGKRALLYLALLVFFFAVALIISANNASAATTVPGGTISTPTVWNAAGSPYTVTGDIIIAPTGVLEITNGTTVMFDPGFGLTVQGKLYVNGTGDLAGINTLTSSAAAPAPGDWIGITFVGAGATGSRIANTNINFATNAVVIQDTSVTVGATINSASGWAYQYIRTTGDLTMSVSGIVVNLAGNGILFRSDTGNVVASVTGTVLTNIDQVAVRAEAPLGNATLTLTGSLFTAPTTLMTVAAEATGYWNATCTIANTQIYYSGVAVQAVAQLKNAAVTANGVTFSNILGGGNYVAGAISSGGNAMVTVTNMRVSNSTNGIWGEATNGGVDISVSGVTFSNLTNPCIYVPFSHEAVNINLVNTQIDASNGAVVVDKNTGGNWFGGVRVTATNVTITGLTGWGVNVYSRNSSATITLTDVIMTGAPGLGAVSAEVNTTATLMATNVQVKSLLTGLSILSASGNVLSDISNCRIDTAVIGISAASGSGTATVTIDPTYINHTAVGVLVSAVGNVAVSMTDVYMNDTMIGVDVTSSQGNVNFAWTNGSMTSSLVGQSGVSLEATVGALTASVNNVNIDLRNDAVWWALNGVPGMDGLRAVSNLSASVTLNDFSVNYGFFGVFVSSDVGSTDFSATALTLSNTRQGVSLSAPNGSVDSAISNVDIGTVGTAVGVLGNISVDVSVQDLTVSGAANGVVVESLVGNLSLMLSGVSITNTGGNGILVYADEGALTADLTGILLNHTGNNAITMQSMGDLDLMMTGVVANDTGNVGVLLLSSMGNVMLDLTNVEITGCGGNGIDIIAAMGTIDVVVDPSVISGCNVGLFLDSAGAVNLSVTNTTFDNNVRGIEIHSQAGGIAVTLVNVQILNSALFGMFVEADQGNVVVGTTQSYLADNFFGFYLRTLLGDVTLNVDNTTFELGNTAVEVQSANDAFVQLVDTQILGQSAAGVYVWAMHDATVTYLRTTFDGSMADNGMLFLPREVENGYVQVDPDALTMTDTWLTVPLDWGFEFNGVVYDQVTMSLYGYIAFGTDQVNGTYANFGPTVPNMIAAAQNPNWMTDEYPGIGYKKFDGAIVFQWYVWQADSPQLKNVFEIWLFEDGGAEISYAMMESKFADPVPAPYAYGVNFLGGKNWDLRLWDPIYYDNDWRSVYFTVEHISNGVASFVHAEGNLTASITHSAVTHWMAGGLIFECANGAMIIEINDTTFEFIGGNINTYWGALSLINPNGPLNAEVTNMRFYFIMGLAIGMLDHPVNGGVSNMAVTNCVFEQVIWCAAMGSFVQDNTLQGNYTLSMTKRAEGNTGVHAGMFFMRNVVATDLAAWNITLETIFQDNNISGDLDPWLQTWFGITDPAPGLMNLGWAEFYSTFVYTTSSDWDSSIQHDTTVMNNVLTGATLFSIGAVGVLDDIANEGAGSITTAFNLDAQGNTISDTTSFFDYGICGVISQTMTSTVADSTASLAVSGNFENNVLNFAMGYGEFGLALVAVQPVAGELGMSNLEFGANVVDNTILYAWQGVYLWSETSVFNSWGAATSDVVVNIQGNNITTYNDGVYMEIISSASFEHYFPPYETEVSATSDITYMVDVSRNDFNVGTDGITVFVSNFAQEDYYGVFTNAIATSSGSIDVYDNYMNRWSGTSGWLMDLEARTESSTGQASSSLNSTISVVNNEMWANGGNGVFIGGGAQTSTLPRRFDDTATATASMDVLFQGNQVWYANNALEVEEWSYAVWGNTMTDVRTTVDILDNVVMEATNEGLYTNLYGYTDDFYGMPTAYMDAVVVVNNNTVSGDGWDGGCWAIDIEIYDDTQGNMGVFMSGSATITMNMVSNARGGIYTYGYPVNDLTATITDNMVDSTYYSIEVDLMAFVIQNNTVTNSAYEAISIYGGTGQILDNTLTGMADMEAWGIDLYEVWYNGYPAYYVTVEGNTISGFGANGIWAENTYGTTITGNEISNCGGWGMEFQGSFDVMDNYISGSLMVANNVINNVGGGVYVSTYLEITIEDNTIDGVSSTYGVWVDNGAGFDIMNNVVSNAYGGVAITNSMDGMVVSNVLSAMPVVGGNGVGINIDNSERIMVTETSVTGFVNGVVVSNSSDVSFVGVVVTQSVSDGGVFSNVGGFLIQDCVFSMNGGNGLRIISSSGAIASTAVSGNFMHGLWIDSSSTVTLTNGAYNNNGDLGLLFERPMQWVVNGNSTVINNPVVFSGELIVKDGGNLLLSMVDFAIYGMPSSITVEAGGMLVAINVDFWLSMGSYYEFNVYGGLDFLDVLVTDALELYLGPTSEANIFNSQIVYNLRNGIVVDGCAPVVMSSMIAMNNRNGLLVINGASPEITDCLIASNAIGIFIRDGDMSKMTDNLIVLNTEAGVLLDQTTGAIKNNIFLLNNKEIFVKGGVVSIEDNQIGYSTLVDVIVQFAPLLGMMNMGSSAYIPMLNIWVSPEALSGLLSGHVGVFAIDGAVVSTSGNDFGMLTTGVMVVNSELTFNDNILSRTLTVPYMGPDGILRNMSLPVPVFDGIVAKNSDVTVNGGIIKVLDDAIYLDGCVASISNATLIAGDFALWSENSEVTVTDSSLQGKIRSDGISMIEVAFALVVVVKDPWGNTLANVPVTIKNAQGDIVKQGTSSANGLFATRAVSFVLTSAGRDDSMNPYSVSADFSGVDTSGYPGHDAEFSPAQPAPTTVVVDGPTSVALQTNVIVKFFLATKATDPSGNVVPGASVVLTSANGLYTYTGTTGDDGMFNVLVNSYIQTPNGMDASAEPYSVQTTFPTSLDNFGGTGGRVEFTPRVVSTDVAVNADMTSVVKTGIKVWYSLTVEAKDKFNRTTEGALIVVTDANGNIAWSDLTGADGKATGEVVGWTQTADGATDASMNPYKVSASFANNPTPAEASVDMGLSNVEMWIQEIVTEFNWTLALTIALIVALLLGVVLMIVARKE